MIQRIPLANPSFWNEIAVGDDAVWVTSSPNVHQDGTPLVQVYRIDPATGVITSTGSPVDVRGDRIEAISQDSTSGRVQQDFDLLVGRALIIETGAIVPLTNIERSSSSHSWRLPLQQQKPVHRFPQSPPRGGGSAPKREAALGGS